jgi:hypothetical protein
MVTINNFAKINPVFSTVHSLLFGETGAYKKIIKKNLFRACVMAYFIFFCGGYVWGYKLFYLLVPLNDHFFPKIIVFLMFVFVSLTLIICVSSLCGLDSAKKQQKIIWSLVPLCLLVGIYFFYASYINHGFSSDNIVSVRLNADVYDVALGVHRFGSNFDVLLTEGINFEEAKVAVELIDFRQWETIEFDEQNIWTGAIKAYYANGRSRLFWLYENGISEDSDEMNSRYYALENIKQVNEWYNSTCTTYLFPWNQYPNNITIKYAAVREKGSQTDVVGPWHDVKYPENLLDRIRKAEALDLLQEEIEEFEKDNWKWNEDRMELAYEYHTNEGNIVRNIISYFIEDQKLFIPGINKHIPTRGYKAELPFVVDERSDSIYLRE